MHDVLKRILEEKGKSEHSEPGSSRKQMDDFLSRILKGLV